MLEFYSKELNVPKTSLKEMLQLQLWNTGPNFESAYRLPSDKQPLRASYRYLEMLFFLV